MKTPEAVKLRGAMALLYGWARVAYGWEPELHVHGYYLMECMVPNHGVLSYQWLAGSYDDAVLRLGQLILELEVR